MGSRPRPALNHSKVTGNASAGGMMSAGGGIASGTLGTGPLATTTLNFSEVTQPVTPDRLAAALTGT